MSKPLIGVTKPNRGALTQNLAIRFVLWLVGARSVNISPNNPESIPPLDGLLLSGGTDIYPELFKSEEVKANYLYDRDRDTLEIKLLEEAKQKRIPIFSICRGAQLLNVYENGTLYTNIQRAFERAEYPSSLLAKIFFRKKICIEPNSKIRDALQTDEAWVNSMHTQSINQVGMGLRVTSKEPNGIIQSIEHENFDYIVGVQFHPEFMIYRKDIRRLFSQFVDYCRKAKEAK